MSDDGDITPEDFDRLLRWLDQEHTRAGAVYDPARAGARHEKIRRRLIIIWASRGGHEPEDWTDEVIRRVTRKVCQIDENWDGNDPLRYFLGVLDLVFKEYLRRLLLPPPPPPPPPSEDDEDRYECLEACLRRLSPEQRELILRYYQGDQRAKIEQRRRLAEELGIGQNALRIRVHRILVRLRECMHDCLDRRGER